MNAFATYRTNIFRATERAASPTDYEAPLRDAQAWWTSVGRAEFIAAFDHETALGLAKAKRSAGARIEQGFPKNVNEYQGKLKWQQYYLANALLAIEQLDRLLQAPPPTDAPWIVHYNIHAPMRAILFDTILLIEDWATFHAEVPGITGVGKNRYETVMALYQSAAQIIHGNVSPLAFLDNHADTAINQIRMAIEMRFRRGFGILAKLDRQGAVVPLALSEILSAIAAHKADINFAVPLHHIERLYGWANIYMHAGLKQYAWSPLAALAYLHPFLIGGRHSRGWSVHAGIRASRGVVREVQQEVEARIDKSRHSLIEQRLIEVEASEEALASWAALTGSAPQGESSAG